MRVYFFYIMHKKMFILKFICEEEGVINHRFDIKTLILYVVCKHDGR